MDLLLQKDLPHQQYAVDAVSKVFENIAVGVPSFYYMNPLVNIKDSNIESNITELQKSVENAECSYLPAKDYLHIDIKMETGTGKTFVYTKTIFELHQRYGFNKFVIAVPSLPIKEGTKSFIEDSYVRKFFADTCGYDCEIELCTVDAAKKQKKGKKYFPSVVRDYVTGSDKIKNKIYDSDLELENIRADIDSVVVYGKIPRRSIAIPTIDGQTYSPDFMYLLKQKDGTQTLNLVVETKDYEHEADLRKAEGYRIECAEEFFKALKADGINVTFERQLRNDKMVSIIGNVLNK